MYKKDFAVIFITSSLIATPLFASDFFHHFAVDPTKKISTALKEKAQFKSKNGVKHFVDFSGTWVGNCTGYEGTDTVAIENSDSEFIINDKIYHIGSLETESRSDKEATFFFHNLLEWNVDYSSLIFSFSSTGHFHGQDLSMKNFGYGTMTISLKNDQLILEGSAQNSNAENDTIFCAYNRQ